MSKRSRIVRRRMRAHKSEAKRALRRFVLFGVERTPGTALTTSSRAVHLTPWADRPEPEYTEPAQ